MIDEKNLRQRMRQIEVLTEEIERLPDANARTKTIELMQLLMEYHGAAIERVMEIIAAKGETGYAIFDDLAADELASSLLLLYGLHPLEIESRVENALEKIRPYLKSHGGDAELLGVENGVVRLNMIGSCNGCPSSGETLKNAIEKAIYEAAPDVAAIMLENVESAQTQTTAGNFVQIGRNNNSNSDKNLHSGSGNSFLNIV